LYNRFIHCYLAQGNTEINVKSILTDSTYHDSGANSGELELFITQCCAMYEVRTSSYIDYI
jgi:hypothetical protein